MSREMTKAPFGGLSHSLSGPQGLVRRGNLGASFPYLGEMMMTDEKLFQNVDVCIKVSTWETNSMKTCGLRFIEVWKNHM